ncbi:MAG: replication-relaxation family protein [Planctomycetota bacterium]
MTDTTTNRQTPSSKRRTLSVWELPKLLQSVHHHRKTLKKPVRERPHFRAILAFVHRNRFAVASQIQRRFAKYLKSDRTARRHLSEMESLGYLEIVETNNTSPLWPKVYFVTRRGLAMLKQALHEQGREWSESLKDRRRSEGQSAQHILHELFITEFLLMAWETTRTQDDLEILSFQRRSLTKHEAFKVVVAGRETRLQPDGMFLYRQLGKGMMCCFVELDLGCMSLRQMAAKLRRYQMWAESSRAATYLTHLYRNFGAVTPAVTFRLMIVVGCRNWQAEDRRVQQLISVASSGTPCFCNNIWIGTVQLLQESAKCAKFLNYPIWVRVRKTSASDKDLTLLSLSEIPRSALIQSSGTKM